MGSPVSSKPQGTLSPAMPARLAGMVSTSVRYICSGSSTLAPSSNAVNGATAAASTSTFSNTSSKSCLTSVRTACALP